ncbi:S-methyl-5-thioribose kinase [Mesobacillus selenatarsenatis]|uniref:S-methyl-5-thioribose kinase n=1 Tax=Mesobacillus selenatarsenatis (strain DSM 18680 / JCM 14380 / FERM P-15431 / SF-1) TaxID=1321606 RepID=A0A0A8X5Y2_MESS1|nr:S-methyl-5-thioribose kinase [Mesobacillus selenatarsenatis]GAM15370.1 5-methylthioribose kinase [Mesobacillus selenatarsenatis SF-1]
MADFNTYFLMNADEVILYVKEKTDFFDKDAELSCTEIGDGNLNYVFRVIDEQSGKSLIVKQAGDTARISDEFKLSTNRIRIESNVLRLEGELAPGLVPDVYLFDDVMNCCVMEDLSDHTILRTALNEGRIFPKLADDLTTFMVNTLLLTSDVVMEHKAKKALVQDYINPELCEISEDLVYSEPFTDHNNRNELFPANKEWIEENIYGDDKLRFEAAKLKFAFMTNAQALVHGDLHSGSVFVKEESTKVIDPEFAFYGPMGYDVGNVVANLMFAWSRAHVTNADEKYVSWLEETIEDTVNLFVEKFLASWKDNVTDIMAKEKGFDRWYLDSVLQDTASVTGMEMIRRIAGLAKVKDMTSIEDEKQRVAAERICLSAAKQFILKSASYKTGEQFLKVLKDSASSHNMR